MCQLILEYQLLLNLIFRWLLKWVSLLECRCQYQLQPLDWMSDWLLIEHLNQVESKHFQNCFLIMKKGLKLFVGVLLKHCLNCLFAHPMMSIVDDSFQLNGRFFAIRLVPLWFTLTCIGAPGGHECVAK